MEVNEFDLAVKVFNQGRAAFDPIPAVQVLNPVYQLHLGAVDMATDDTVGLLVAGHRGQGALVFGYKFHSGLGLEFQKCRQ